MTSLEKKLPAVHKRDHEGYSTRGNFDLRMQSIRGMAALVVAFHHSINCYPLPASWARLMRGIEGVVSPQAAVLTFFILSGYVLGLSLDREKRITFPVYLRFMVKRLCRIMWPLACLVTISGLVVSLLLWLCTRATYVDPQAWGHSLLGTSYSRPFSWLVLVQNVPLIHHDLDPVTWTITIEMVGSLLIPVFFQLNRHPLSRFLMLAILVLAYFVPDASGTSPIRYLFMFDLGLLFPWWGQQVLGRLRRLRLLVPLSLICFLSIILNAHFGYNFLVMAASLALLLAYVAYNESPMLHLLDSRPMIWLGKVSYSFYLLHWPILWILAWATAFFLPILPRTYPLSCEMVICLVSVSLAAAAGEVSYQAIEVPGINFGKRLIAAGRLHLPTAFGPPS